MSTPFRFIDALRTAAALVATAALLLTGVHAGEAAGDDSHAKSACEICFAAGPADIPQPAPAPAPREASAEALIAETAKSAIIIKQRAPSQPRAPPLS